MDLWSNTKLPTKVMPISASAISSPHIAEVILLLFLSSTSLGQTVIGRWHIDLGKARLPHE
jgi:hypothetical protein